MRRRGSPENETGTPARHLAVRIDINAVNPDSLDTYRWTLRIVRGGMVGDASWIEEDEVGSQAGPNQAAIRQTHVLRGQAGHLANGFFQG